MKLIELEPQFIKYETRVPDRDYASPEYKLYVDGPQNAQGVQFLCPSCFVKNHGPVGTHLIEVSFAGRGVKDNQGSHGRDGQPTRWGVSGTSIENLSTQPSILVDPAPPSCDGWHGYITNGNVS